MDRLLRPVMSSTSSRPAETASSTTYWISGLSTTGSISLGIALVAGRNRVPRPPTGNTALRTVKLAMRPRIKLKALELRDDHLIKDHAGGFASVFWRAARRSGDCHSGGRRKPVAGRQQAAEEDVQRHQERAVHELVLDQRHPGRDPQAGRLEHHQ